MAWRALKTSLAVSLRQFHPELASAEASGSMRRGGACRTVALSTVIRMHQLVSRATREFLLQRSTALRPGVARLLSSASDAQSDAVAAQAPPALGAPGEAAAAGAPAAGDSSQRSAGEAERPSAGGADGRGYPRSRDSRSSRWAERGGSNRGGGGGGSGDGMRSRQGPRSRAYRDQQVGKTGW